MVEENRKVGIVRGLWRRQEPGQDKGEHFPRKCNANAAERQPFLYEMHIVKVLGGSPSLEEIELKILKIFKNNLIT